ncbi:MAG: 2-oxoacid:acceptor oxidoreductase subunit alpha [Gammaproteobacteria bacterium]|nr:2-oxoacid:acceptor oxidoreductase subunit alpha [Gammaproteobacteria bacterium]MBL6999514.1 2-oxoacid:acceptor oxidoreductase subunit alpha [Gammaproteobacteria bacterium]
MSILSCTQSLAVTGSGGSGAITVGNMLLQIAASSGLYGIMRRSVGPQIRGGESAALLRLSAQPVSGPDDRFDLLLAFDWLNADRFALEIPLDSASLIISDSAHSEIPDVILQSGARVIQIPLQQMAADISGGRVNMIGLGLLCALLELPSELSRTVIRSTLASKGEAAIEAALQSFDAGARYETSFQLPCPALQGGTTAARWNISGNEACALGALQGGVRFVAAYPITPATDLLEWLAPRIEKIGGSLLQAEDELASINMVIGASFGGVCSMTATSGPGLSLMAEGIGLAIASEIPLVVVNVTRGGPSTGIPTKSEQSDLNIALYGQHGDAPHLVLAPQNISDCIQTTRWAVQLAEILQTPAIVLSDQFLGQSRFVIPAPEPVVDSDSIARLRQIQHSASATPYQRYLINDSAISPMALPGTAGCSYTADGLEHTCTGKPSSIATDHHDQLDKRQHKLTRYAFGTQWAEVQGSGPIAILCWGSSSMAVLEAAERLQQSGQPVKVIAIRLLAPAQTAALERELQDVSQLLVVEQSHSQQFYRYLRAHYALPAQVQVYAKPGPLAITPGQICQALQALSGESI